MCPACLAEYADPADRRFHAKPNACTVCGPKLTLLNSRGEVMMAHDPLEQAIKILRHGFILAVKGFGERKPGRKSPWLSWCATCRRPWPI
jgi:hydrogenase maturation protein HypF